MKEHPTIPAPTRAALAELQGMIAARYPETQFAVFRGEDPEGWYLRAVVDVDDPDEVTELVLDRLVDLQLDEGLPLHVIPIRTPERLASLRAQQVAERHHVTPAPLS